MRCEPSVFGATIPVLGISQKAKLSIHQIHPLLSPCLIHSLVQSASQPLTGVDAQTQAGQDDRRRGQWGCLTDKALACLHRRFAPRDTPPTSPPLPLSLSHSSTKSTLPIFDTADVTNPIHPDDPSGPMAAGKGHVIRWLSREGHFQLPSIVQIDPGASYTPEPYP